MIDLLKYNTHVVTSCSSLNHHLVSKNIINDTYCQCGSVETSKHYLFECQRYSQLRQETLNEISKYCTPSLDCLLFGDDHLNHSCNSDVFLAVQFIFESKRFKSRETLSFSLSSLYIHVYWFELKFGSIINSYFFVNVTG